MKLETSVLSKLRQPQKDKFLPVSLGCTIRFKKIKTWKQRGNYLGKGKEIDQAGGKESNKRGQHGQSTLHIYEDVTVKPILVTYVDLRKCPLD